MIWPRWIYDLNSLSFYNNQTISFKVMILYVDWLCKSSKMLIFLVLQNVSTLKISMRLNNYNALLSEIG